MERIRENVKFDTLKSHTVLSMALVCFACIWLVGYIAWKNWRGWFMAPFVFIYHGATPSMDWLLYCRPSDKTYVCIGHILRTDESVDQHEHKTRKVNRESR